MPLPLRTLLTGVLLTLAACNSSPISPKGSLGSDRVPEVIEASRALDVDTASPRALAKSVGDLLKATRSNLESDQRAAVQTLLDRHATELAARGDDPDVLEDLTAVDLPARIAVPAGLRAARIWFDQKDRRDAFRVVRRLDERYPNHALSDQAGDLLWDIATSYRDDTGRRLFIFRYSERAPNVFEYLSSGYPSHPRTDDALRELAHYYADRRRFDLAIERYDDLLLWAPDSQFRAESEAAIPQLRLDDLDGPAYGRGQLLVAEAELTAWIERFGDHELRPEVDRALVDCLQRLADNDLVVARFYRRVKNAAGTRRHAERALGYARRAGNDEQIEEVLDVLASVDEIEEVDAPELLPGAVAPGLESFDPAGTGASTPTPLAPSDPLDLESRRDLSNPPPADGGPEGPQGDDR